jgi:hypothetical protein
MMEFLRQYGFFILVVLLMIGCHLLHPGHGGHEEREKKNNGGRR